MIPTEFLLYLSNFILSPNPMLLTKEDEFPIDFCGGTSFAVSCVEDTNQEAISILNHLSSLNANGKIINPVMLSDGNHTDLVIELNKDPLAFTQNGLWLMPIEYQPLIDLRLDSKIFFYSGNSLDGFVLHESYTIKGGMPITTRLAEWQPRDSNLIEGGSELVTGFMERRSDLQGIALRHSWFEEPPYITFITDDSGQVVNSVGFNAAIVAELQAQLNFKKIDITPTVESWGRKLENGSWIGIVGMLVDKDIDVSALGILITPERLKAADFCWSTSSEKVTLMTTESTSSKLNVWVFLDIFPMEVWILTIALIMLGTLFFSMASRVPLSEGFALMVRLGLQMSYEILTPNKTTKALLLVSAMCLNVVFIYFSCDLTTRMTVEPPKLNIRSFEDVIKNGYKVITEDEEWEELAEAPSGSAMKKVATNHIIHLFHDEEEDEALEGFFDGQYGDRVLLYGVHDPYSDDEFEKQLIGLDIEEATTKYASIALQKDSEFKEIFNYHIMKLFEMGVVDRLRRKYLFRHDEDYGLLDAVSLGYENLFFPFGIMAMGVVIAGLSMAGEGITGSRKPVIKVPRMN